MNVSTMNKVQLRAECKKVGVKGYSKLTVGGMRDALVQRDTTLLAEVFPAGAKPSKPAPQPRVEREERNGVKRPGGPKCAAVWDFCDAFLKKNGTPPTLADAREWAKREKVNENNACIETSGWRRFHGISKPKKT